MTATGTTSDNEWQWVTKNDNKWQRVTASGKANENCAIHIKEWIIDLIFCDYFKGLMTAFRVVK